MMRTATFPREYVVAISATSGTQTLDLSVNSGGAVYYTVTVAGSTTFTVNAAKISSGIVYSFTLAITNGGSQTLTWTNGKWAGGAAPTFTTSGLDIVVGITSDGGTTVDYVLANKAVA